MSEQINHCRRAYIGPGLVNINMANISAPYNIKHCSHISNVKINKYINKVPKTRWVPLSLISSTFFLKEHYKPSRILPVLPVHLLCLCLFYLINCTVTLWTAHSGTLNRRHINKMCTTKQKSSLITSRCMLSFNLLNRTAQYEMWEKQIFAHRIFVSGSCNMMLSRN